MPGLRRKTSRNYDTYFPSRVEWNLAMIQGEKRLGDIIYVRYKDHVLFRDMDSSTANPFTRECIGWLDFEGEDYVRIVWERFSMPDPPNEAKPRATGLVILKKALMEIRRIV